jgi:predicted phage terminase large subunit-like protein
MGRRFGKTELMKEMIINYPRGAFGGMDGSGRKGLPCAWYAPNDAYFIRVFHDVVRQYLSAIKRATAQPRPVIEFINGGRIDFWTLENPMKCGRGNHYARIVVDEAAHARHLQDAWEKTISWTLADLNGDAWFISTPNGMNYFSDLFDKSKTDQDWISHRAPSYDNPYLPKGWMEDQQKTMPDLVYQQEVLAHFVTFGAGGVFKPDLMPVLEAIPANTHFVRGWDMAATQDGGDYTVGVKLGKLPCGRWIIADVVRLQGAPDVVEAAIKNTASRDGVDVRISIPQDPGQAGKAQVQYYTLQLAGFPITSTPETGDKLTRSLPIAAQINAGNVSLLKAPWNDALISEMRVFPGGKNDDQVDALSRAFTEMNKNQFGILDYMSDMARAS